MQPYSAFRRTSFWIFVILVAAFAFLDYWAYSQQFRLNPESIAALAGGSGPAPAQYRVGVIYAAKLILRVTRGHISYRHSFAVFDFVFALAASLLMRSVLLRTRSFQIAPPLSQWVRIFILIGLSTYYLNWSMWYQRPETWACTLFVAASMYLLYAVRSSLAVIISLVTLAIVQGVIRSDVAILFHFALFVCILFRSGRSFLVNKNTLLVSSFLGGILPTAILWTLIHKIFPHASYGDTAVFQLLRNLSPTQWVPALLFLAPTLYTYIRANWFGSSTEGTTEDQGNVLLLASALYLGSWAIVGRLEEVRIFIPFAFALMPQTANALAEHIELSSNTKARL